jgi:predicted dienelactone hydrolase
MRAQAKAGRQTKPGIRRSAAQVAALATALTGLGAQPALALEEVVLKLPLVQNTFRVRVSELSSTAALMNGNSDLAELDRATDGSIGRQLHDLLTKPLPIDVSRVTEQAVGTPMLEQGLLMLSTLGTVEGSEQDLTGSKLNEAFMKASAAGPITLLSLMEAIPGERVTLDLGKLGLRLQRMVEQRDEAEKLVGSSSTAAPAPTTTDATALAGTSLAVQRKVLQLPVSHRPGTLLELTVVQPQSGGRGRLVLISHGLWDSPASFEGWAQLLAANGYTVVLPRHPGSDQREQQAMLTGQAPPPGHQELELRPRDISAVLDAVASGQIDLGPGIQADRVVVIGHSWGATTSLQLAGMAASSREVQRCTNPDDPDRNLSWVLQCSWLQGKTITQLGDPRVVAVAAVSPPVSLLFPRGSSKDLGARVLLVSGSRDWVVPPDPEAVKPMQVGVARGNRLVLAQGGDHFNLRPGQQASGGVLGPLLLAWTDGAFNAGDGVRPGAQAPNLLPPTGWGQTGMTLVDVSDRLKQP